MARRIVAPETHARPPGLLTRVLHSTGLATPAKPLLDPDTESITNPSYVGTAASHLLGVNNWTMGLHDAELGLVERAQRHLLILEVSSCVGRHTTVRVRLWVGMQGVRVCLRNPGNISRARWRRRAAMQRSICSYCSLPRHQLLPRPAVPTLWPPRAPPCRTASLLAFRRHVPPVSSTSCYRLVLGAC